jgi:hypothetical protein
MTSFTAEDHRFRPAIAEDWLRLRRPRSIPVHLRQEALVMKIPIETKPALWGMAGGAIAAAIVGFSWGGWVTGGRAEADATQRANAAVVGALASVCVERFERATDVTANLAALKKVDSWSQGDFIEKGGWAAVPGSKAPDQVSAVAKACASLLAPA